MDRQPDRARPLSAHLPGGGHRLSGGRVLADLPSTTGGMRRGRMRHAFLQPPGKDGLVACHGDERTRRPLPLSRPPIARSLTTETMMTKTTLIASPAERIPTVAAFSSIRYATLVVANNTHAHQGP